MIPRQARTPQRRADTGSVAVWLLFITPVLFAFAGLVLDGGRILTARQHAANIAEQAARAGMDALDVAQFRASGGTVDVIDPVAAEQVACGYVAAAAPTASCSIEVTGNQVSVTVSLSTSTAILAAVGADSITTTAVGVARPAVGITSEGS
ncbi:MAG: pilus assembly protein TadG-related protein [Sporichthyaceae bacterium]|nr:pilus assembly protein TadG-related protein [Sporichthyaceae bacterium]